MNLTLHCSVHCTKSAGLFVKRHGVTASCHGVT